MEGEETMERKRVSSSNIHSVGYDAEARILEIKFHSGGIYRYSNVPETVHCHLMKAASKGSYFHQSIRDKYNFKRVR